MAKGASTMDKLKDLWDSQVNDEKQWNLNVEVNEEEGKRKVRKSNNNFTPKEVNGENPLQTIHLLEFLSSNWMKLMTATGLFVGSIFFMRNFGELMSI